MKLDVQNIGFQYTRGRDVFRDVSFTLCEGETLSILGVNGAGKSTLLSCLAGLLRPKEGTILLDGKSLSDMSRKEIARCVGYVPQLHGSSFAYSVLEFAVMGRTPYIPPYGTPSKEDYAIAMDKLEQVGMGHMANKVFTEISGGEQQLTMIARVLTQEPKLILLDEPTNHLDYGNQYRTVDIMKQLAEAGYIVITTTHNPDHALKLGGKAAILTPGGSLRVGLAEAELTPERLSELYGIPIGVMDSAEAGRRLCYTKNAGGNL